MLGLACSQGTGAAPAADIAGMSAAGHARRFTTLICLCPRHCKATCSELRVRLPVVVGGQARTTHSVPLGDVAMFPQSARRLPLDASERARQDSPSGTAEGPMVCRRVALGSAARSSRRFLSL